MGYAFQNSLDGSKPPVNGLSEAYSRFYNPTAACSPALPLFFRQF